MNDQIEKEPSIGISITHELPGKKNIVLQTFMPRECDPGELHAILDKLNDSADAQFSRYMVEVLKVELKQHEKMGEDHAMRMAQVEKNIEAERAKNNRRVGHVLSPKEQQEQSAAVQNLEETKRRISLIKEDIARHEKIAAGPKG